MTNNALHERITTLCDAAIAARAFPGGQIAYVRNGQVTSLAFGRLRYDEDAPVTEETLYDVASVTKSIPTSSIILKLIEDGRLSLDDHVTDYLPELRQADRESILLRHLLTYTVVFEFGGGLAELAKAMPGKLLHSIFTAPLKAAPGQAYYYTNAPAILLGLIAEKVVGQPLDKIAREMFFELLEMRRTTFKPRLEIRQVAPSERTEDGDILGQPHDEAARALKRQGIVAGNAALFSTASDILKFAQMLLAEGTWGGRTYFAPSTVQSMHTNQIADIGKQTGLGWEMREALLPKGVGSQDVFGKTGFTGCAVVIDPVVHTAFVYLTNRNYPTRPGSREAIVAFRHELARILLAP